MDRSTYMLAQHNTIRIDPAGAECYGKGTCLYNIDGAPVKGGILANGGGGFRQPTMGFFDAGGGSQCTALGLFVSGNVPYTTTGMAASTNAQALLQNRWPNI
jgi:hypothetical protein